MSKGVWEPRRNCKQNEFLAEVLDNKADYDKPGKGKYQIGFHATGNWSRATGKTYTELDLIGFSAYELPGAVAGLWSSTYTQVQNIILSQSSSVWKEHGLYEYDEKSNRRGNYVVNRKPPAHFDRAHNSPRSFENTICFANGYLVKMISADRPDTARGGSYDQLFGDEVGFARPDFYEMVLIPSLRANKRVYRDYRPGRSGYNHPLHWLSVNFSSLPYSLEGRWFMKAEELMEKHPSKYFFSKANAYDNLENLPGDFIEQQREILSPIKFMVEIENKILDKLPNSFYSAYDFYKHVGTRYTYEFDPLTRKYIEKDCWYDTLKAFDMSWDFNGYFTCCTLSQDFIKEYNEYVFMDEFFAKESSTTLVEKVCYDFIAKHQYHIKKVIYLHGDRSGKNKDPDRNITLYAKIKSILTIAGWTVIDRVQDVYPSYQSRYVLINDMLSETKPKYPKIRIHAKRCPSVYASIQGAQLLNKDTFEKSKKLEGKDSVPQELATHFSDDFDYVLYEKFKNYSDNTTSRSAPIKVRG
jgi:hypothetical protein